VGLFTARTRHALTLITRRQYYLNVSSEQHRATSPATARAFVISISDSRTPQTDSSGDAICSLLTEAGHELLGRTLVKDDPQFVRDAISGRPEATQIVITSGGTGITSRDSTYEAITALFDKRLDGFGELFRMLSYDEIGSAAMLSRACAGTVGRTAVFSLPGSEHAVRLAMTKLILPELGHVVRELNR
jgi:molybdenum cofactor biosynthesis protein B